VKGARLLQRVLAALALASVAVVPLARADDGPRPPSRPKFQVALGLGASVDHNEPNPTPDSPIPSFFFAAGLGDGSLGLEARAFANGATGTQITRLAGELVAVLRPFDRAMRERPSYGARVLRAASIDVGPSIERVSRGPLSARRFGVMFGGHLDLPVGPPGMSKEMRVRLGARRLRAGHATLADIRVDDSALELYGQLAFVF
jgi:hypothetical protein